MPHLLPHPRSRPHRPPGRAAIGLLAVMAAALTACSSAATTPHPAAADVADLTGAGSTFDAPFFNLAFPAYQQAHPDTAVSYAAVGSSAGITRFTAGQVNFGVTDVPASPADLAGARGGPALQVPVDLGAVAVAYNVLTLSNTPLRLSGPVLAKIFLGLITKWNDPALTALNPGADLPDAYITVVHRSDGSGTTYIFSNYLSATSKPPTPPAPPSATPPSPTATAATPPPPRPRSPPTPPPSPPSPPRTSPSSTSPGRPRTGRLVLGEPGLCYRGPWADGIQHGWLVVVGITNPGPATVRGGDFRAPLAFAFPGRTVHAARLLPESAGRPARTGPGMPAVRVPGQGGPAAARVELTGDFLLRPGDSYSLLLILGGTPAGQSRRIRHEGSLARGRIIPPWGQGPLACGDGGWNAR